MYYHVKTSTLRDPSVEVPRLIVCPTENSQREPQSQITSLPFLRRNEGGDGLGHYVRVVSGDDWDKLCRLRTDKKVSTGLSPVPLTQKSGVTSSQ